MQPAHAFESVVADEVTSVRSWIAAGRLAVALATVDAAIGPSPDDPGLMHLRGCVLIAWNRHVEALAAFCRGIACGGNQLELLIDAGWCSYMLGDFTQAERLQSRAVAAAPDSSEAHFALGVVLRAKKDFTAAVECFDKVRVLSPAYADCALNVAMCERGMGNQAAAEAWLRRAIADNERDPRAWCLLGMVLVVQERHEEAFASYRRARELERETGSDARTLAQYVASLLTLGRVEDALALCEGGLAESPDPSAHSHYAFALLTTGRFHEGWQQYEYRWFEEPMRAARSRYPVPVWNGQSLAGKTVLLRGEQGFGDIIQFARYATPLKALGATVIMQVHVGIVELAQHFADVDRVLAKEEAFTRFDYYVEMMSLPRVFGTEVATIPAHVPYVGTDAAQVVRWSARLGNDARPRVGLVWAGNPDHLRDHARSIALEKLAPLWEVAGVRYVSLQKVPRPGDAAKMPPASTMLALGPALQNFAETAALIETLDLVVCVDTAIAHLAGAMGKPVWLMVPTVVDFRWMLEREDSPWYPTMRIFRQHEPGNWSAVVDRVAGNLRRWATGDATVLHAPRANTVTEPEAAPPATAARIARVTEARDGIFQYLPDLDPEARSIAWYGEFLTAQLDVLAQVVPTDAHLVEFGAGIGAHALWFARVLGPEAHLFLYEERPIVRRLLSQNLDSNALSGRATLVRGTLGASGALPPPAHTLDELRLARLDLLKVEVPGRVEEILRGAEGTLWRLRPRLSLSAQDEGALAAWSERLRAYGYRCWRVDVPCFNPRNFNRREVDIFAGARWLGLLAVPEEVDAASALARLPEI